MDRAMESDRTTIDHGIVGLPAGDLVAKGRPATQVTRRNETTEVETVTQPTTSPTLDTLFKRILARQPDALALVDPLNKQRITGQPRKRLTYAQADRAISAISAHFIESGLPANSVIAVQLPGTVEFALTVLAAHRVGLVVAP